MDDKCRMLLWHDRDEAPRKGKYTIVKKDDKFYLDYIGENFDDWADDVEQWAYVFKDDEHDKAIRLHKEDMKDWFEFREAKKDGLYEKALKAMKDYAEKNDKELPNITINIDTINPILVESGGKYENVSNWTNPYNADDNSSMPDNNSWGGSWEKVYNDFIKFFEEKYTNNNEWGSECDIRNSNDEKHSSKPRSISGAEKECYLTVWRSVLERWEHGTIIFPLDVVRRLNYIFTYLDSGRGEYIPWNTIGSYSNWDF